MLENVHGMIMNIRNTGGLLRECENAIIHKKGDKEDVNNYEPVVYKVL